MSPLFQITVGLLLKIEGFSPPECGRGFPIKNGSGIYLVGASKTPERNSLSVFLFKDTCPDSPEFLVPSWVRRLYAEFGTYMSLILRLKLLFIACGVAIAHDLTSEPPRKALLR